MSFLTSLPSLYLTKQSPLNQFKICIAALLYKWLQDIDSLREI